MNTTTLVLAAFLALAACAAEGRLTAKDQATECERPGYTYVDIHYGDSKLFVRPVITVHQGTQLQYRLKPERQPDDKIDYKNVTVTIADEADSDAHWMHAKGTYSKNKDGILKICVKTDQAVKEYKYRIVVDGVGVLDPRADVQR